MNKEERKKQEILRQMMRLARGKSNDVARLVFAENISEKKLAEMDLSGLLSIKRHGNGAVELQLVNRVEVLCRLFEMLQNSGNEQLDAFLEATKE